MKIQYLGTGAAEGIPAMFCSCPVCAHARTHGGRNIRTRSSALIDDRIIIDLSPDVYSHSLRYGISMGDIRSLLVTHSHHDHFAAYELVYRLKGFAAIPDDKPPLIVYSGSEVGDKLLALEWNLAGRIEYKPLTAFSKVQIEGYTVTPLPADHKKNESCFIYHIEREGRRLLYGHDTGYFPEPVWEWLTGRDIHITSLDCTCGMADSDRNHMGFSANLRVHDRMLSIGAAADDAIFISNHFSHNGRASYDDLVAMAESRGFIISYDGMETQVF